MHQVPAWAWVGALLTLVLGGLVLVSLPPQLPGAVAIVEAVAQLDEPTTVPPRAVKLPHIWDDERPPWEGTGRYAIAWPPQLSEADHAAQPLAVYLPRVGSRFRVWLNDRLIAENSWDDPGYVDTSVMPHMVTLPAELLAKDARQNRLVVEVRGTLLRKSGLSPLVIGPKDVVETRFKKIYWWQVQATWMVAACSVLLALLSGLIWLQARERVFALLAAASTAWAIRLALTPLVEPNMPFELWFYLHKLSFTVYCGFLYLFLWELFDFRQGFARRLVVGLLWVGPVWLGVTTLTGNYNMYRIWTAVLAVISIITLVLMFRRARWGLDGDQRLMVVVGIVTLVTGVRDFLVVQLNFPGDGDLRWMTTGSLVFMLTLAWVMVQRTSSYMQQIGQLNQDLEQRVRDREQELHHAFDQLREAERRQVLEDERQRLTRDMHDGLGSQLVQTLNLVRGGTKTDSAAVEAMLTHALEELRMTLDSMEPLEGDLPAILGTLRRRIGPALEAAGIELVWQVEELAPITVRGEPMDSRGVMHLFRCLQEVFANIVKHAGATQVTVRTWMDGATALMSVTDNGRGLGAGSREGGRGMSNIRLRAAELGGTVTFSDTRPGTCVVFSFSTGA
ncbi:ATP-binding protein [Variovorax sp. VNK109]|uniref:sensor histidine kinase n=1 Tax=Variovorax sp. VNK109 TaxID=3400919 RepID=UPI003C057460